MKKKFKLKIDNFINLIQNEIHLELFEEEYIERLDSNSESYEREFLGKNPMKQDFITKIKEKRGKLGVSPLSKNGKPYDNSSEIYVKNMIYSYLNEKQEKENFEIKQKHNISSFFKKQKKLDNI